MKAFMSALALVLLSAATASAGITAPQPVSVPTLAPWGMVGTAVAMGLSGLYFIFKRNK
ncbi:MAG: hypothetical protein P8013_09185 [Candidatus Sulfobium sp.]|jgi:hypothetical protein